MSILYPQVLGRNYGRSIVISQQGIAATSQVLASQTGAQILARGGSAVDAAIASNAVLGVTEPMMTGLGGDLFVMYWDAKTEKLTGLNASGARAKRSISGVSRAARHQEHAARWHSQRHGSGRRCGLVPNASALRKTSLEGPVSGCDHVRRTGGFRFTRECTRSGLRPILFTALEANLESKRVFLPGGKAPHTGELFKNPDMARAFRLIAEQGPDAFYKGAIATAIVKTSERLGGTMTAQDLAAYSSEWVAPLSIDYRGWRVYELPPNGRAWRRSRCSTSWRLPPPSPLGALSAPEMHKRIEAMKLAYSDIHANVADPRVHDAPRGSAAFERVRAQACRPDRLRIAPIAKCRLATLLAVIRRI